MVSDAKKEFLPNTYKQFILDLKNVTIRYESLLDNYNEVDIEAIKNLSYKISYVIYEGHADFIEYFEKERYYMFFAKVIADSISPIIVKSAIVILINFLYMKPSCIKFMVEINIFEPVFRTMMNTSNPKLIDVCVRLFHNLYCDMEELDAELMKFFEPFFNLILNNHQIDNCHFEAYGSMIELYCAFNYPIININQVIMVLKAIKELFQREIYDKYLDCTLSLLRKKDSNIDNYLFMDVSDGINVIYELAQIIIKKHELINNLIKETRNLDDFKRKQRLYEIDKLKLTLKVIYLALNREIPDSLELSLFPFDIIIKESKMYLNYHESDIDFNCCDISIKALKVLGLYIKLHSENAISNISNNLVYSDYLDIINELQYQFVKEFVNFSLITLSNCNYNQFLAFVKMNLFEVALEKLDTNREDHMYYLNEMAKNFSCFLQNEGFYKALAPYAELISNVANEFDYTNNFSFIETHIKNYLENGYNNFGNYMDDDEHYNQFDDESPGASDGQEDYS